MVIHCLHPRLKEVLTNTTQVSRRLVVQIIPDLISRVIHAVANALGSYSSVTLIGMTPRENLILYRLNQFKIQLFMGAIMS